MGESALADNALSVSPPDEVYALAGTTSSEGFKLPTKFHGAWITIQAQGQDVFVIIRKGIAEPTVSATDVSAIASDEITADVNTGVHIPAGQERPFDLRHIKPGIPARSDGATERLWMAHLEAATGGFLRFWKSSGPKG